MEKSTREDASQQDAHGRVAWWWTVPLLTRHLIWHDRANAMVEATVSQGHSHQEGQLQGHHISLLSPLINVTTWRQQTRNRSHPLQRSRCVNGGSVEGIVTVALNFAL